MACSSGCPTPGAHETWGACLRAKKLQIADVDAHLSNTALSKSLDDYRTAREAGLQPEGVHAHQVRDAWKKTDASGVAYRADQTGGGLL